MTFVAKTVKTMSGDRGDWIARPADRTASRPAERTPKSSSVAFAAKPRPSFFRMGSSWLGARRRRSSKSLPGRVDGYRLPKPARKGQGPAAIADLGRGLRPPLSAAESCRRTSGRRSFECARVRSAGAPTSGVARRRGPARGSPAGPAVAQNSRHDRAPRNWVLAGW